jgi:hypothetical protein
MPNWNHIVREHLAVLRLPPEREIEIVEELALHMETSYEAALADGLAEKGSVAKIPWPHKMFWQLLAHYYYGMWSKYFLQQIRPEC